MGKITAVCSETKNSGKSVFTYIFASQIRELASDDTKILVCCLNSKHSLLYKLFGVNESAPGIEELINFQSVNYGGTELLEDIIPRREGIYFLGSYRTTNSYANKNISNFSKLFDELQKRFDLIIFDTVSSKENILTNLILKKASTVVNLFVQDAESINKLSRIKESKKESNQKAVYLISKYRDIYPRANDIKRRFGLEMVYTMNYCKLLQEMKNRDSLHLYIQRDTECNRSVKLITEHIIKTTGLSKRNIRADKKWLNQLRSTFCNLFMSQ